MQSPKCDSPYTFVVVGQLKTNQRFRSRSVSLTHSSKRKCAPEPDIGIGIPKCFDESLSGIRRAGAGVRQRLCCTASNFQVRGPQAISRGNGVEAGLGGCDPVAARRSAEKEHTGQDSQGAQWATPPYAVLEWIPCSPHADQT